MAVASFGANAIDSLQNILRIGANNAKAGVGAAQSGVNAVLAGGAQIRQDTGAMRDQAHLVNTQAGKVNQSADAILKNAEGLRPIADKLKGYGDDLWGQGSALWGESKDAFGQAGALTSLDPNATGLAGEFIKQYGLLSPDRYVSRAASDVQGSFNNAQGQVERDLQRRGVSAGSGASIALRKQYSQALATALAAAKTKARQMGIDEQSKMLETMTDAASKFYGMGTSAGSLASQVQGQAAEAQKGAAGIISDIGQQISSAGSLQSNAGQLYAAGANIFGSAADIEKGYLALTNDAYKGLSDAYSKAAKYYLDAADTEVRANTSGGGGGSHGVQFAHVGLDGEILRPGMVW
jgi:hypothetical protein